jgi:hypothetical protein
MIRDVEACSARQEQLQMARLHRHYQPTDSDFFHRLPLQGHLPDRHFQRQNCHVNEKEKKKIC